jgi:5-methylcytosine-specific restriction endonuclease McrA
MADAGPVSRQPAPTSVGSWIPCPGMSRSLVLNASYEPLSVVSARRAVVLVLADKADVVHATEDLVHSERLTLEVPSVIRLRYFVRVPYRRTAALSRRGVFLRDGGQCQYCGRRAESIDHVVPRSRGGLHIWENVVAACGRCNAIKRDRLLEDTAMRLRRHPRSPEHLSWVAVAVNRVPEVWTQYLGLAGAVSA